MDLKNDIATLVNVAVILFCVFGSIICVLIIRANNLAKQQLLKKIMLTGLGGGALLVNIIVLIMLGVHYNFGNAIFDDRTFWVFILCLPVTISMWITIYRTYWMWIDIDWSDILKKGRNKETK